MIAVNSLCTLLTTIPLIHLLATTESRPQMIMWNSREKQWRKTYKYIHANWLTFIEIRPKVLNFVEVTTKTKEMSRARVIITHHYYIQVRRFYTCAYKFQDTELPHNQEDGNLWSQLPRSLLVYRYRSFYRYVKCDKFWVSNCVNLKLYSLKQSLLPPKNTVSTPSRARNKMKEWLFSTSLLLCVRVFWILKCTVKKSWQFEKWHFHRTHRILCDLLST